MPEESSNRRIAKNTMMLYIRMLLSMFVGLYTSRVVLQTLGVEDYGTYGVVGGIVSILGFLNASMSGATSRFLTFEIGKEDWVRVRKTFSSALIVHIGIALIILVAAETIGLWFLHNKLVIPEGRMLAAEIVYQCSVISAMITITQVPYNAAIIAHEDMDIYAYVELFNVFLKLGIVYLLAIGDFDKLILYAILVLIVSIVIAMTYRFYCLNHYTECHFKWVWDQSVLHPLLSFSGWDLYGNLCGTAKQQGTVILLNMFFGPIVNAASNIANTIIGVLSGLSMNVVTAFRPQIIKKYANGSFNELTQMLNRSMSITSFLLSLLVFPVVAEMPFVLQVWLGEVPDYAIVLAQIAVFNSFVGNLNAVVLIALHATGNIKNVSFWGGTLYLVNLVVCYLLLKFHFISAYSVMITNVLFLALVMIVDIILIKRQIPQINTNRIVGRTLVPILIASVGLFVFCEYIQSRLSYDWKSLFYSFAIFSIITILIYFLFVFSKSDRIYIYQFLFKLYGKFSRSVHRYS